MKQEKIHEKEKLILQKEKQKRQPLEYCKKQLKELSKIDKVFDFTEKVKEKAISDKILKWIYNSIEPYNVFLTGEKGKQVFKNNAVNFINFIMNMRSKNNFGMISTNSQRNRERYFLKTKHGIITGNEAKMYLGYVLRNLLLLPIKEIVGKRYEQNCKKKDSIEDSFIQLSYFQLFNNNSIDYMTRILIERSMNEKFKKYYQKICILHQQDELIKKLPKEIIKDISKNGVENIFTDSESESDSDSENSESDSDIDNENSESETE